MNTPLAWHDFPGVEGTYFIRDGGHRYCFDIRGSGDTGFYYRPGAGSWPYDYPFNPSEYSGNCFGPVTLPPL